MSTPNLAAALIAAQAEMPKVEPDAVNPHFKSKFVSLDHLIAKTRPVLTKHGLAIVQEPHTAEKDGRAYHVLKTTLLHTSGEERSAMMSLVLAREDMQGLGAAITYARRYAWASLLGISEQEDDDGNQASAPPKAAQKSRRTENTAPDTAEAENVLLALVLAKNGDVEAVKAAIEAERSTSEFVAWLEFQRDWWNTYEPAEAAA